MFKKFIIISLLLIVPFFNISPKFVIAQSTSSTTTQTESTGWSIWQAISSLLSRIISGTSGIFVSKNTIIPCKEESKLTDYNNETINANYRIQSNSSQKYEKGSYLKAIINGDYEDKTISYLCNNVCSDSKTDDSCIDIHYSTLVYYFYKYKNGEKILYDKDNSKNPIEYDSAKMDSYNYTLPPNSDAYFRNLYNKISQIPKGAYKGEANGAVTSSNELNYSTRYIQSALFQTEKTSTDISTEKNVEIKVKDNDINQRNFFLTDMPATNQKDIKDSTNINTLKTRSAKIKHPRSWQNSSDDEEEPVERANENNGCNAESSHCRGMSQYGALGMALAGKSYQEILKTYYGNVKLVKLDTFIEKKKMFVQVDISDGSCDKDGKKVTTIKVQIEQYLRKLGELPSSWGDKGDLLPNGQREGINALKAQAIVARTKAFFQTAGFTKSICNTAKCQVYRCTMGDKPNFNTAITQTAYMILVDATTGMPFDTQYARTFCGPSKIYNSWFRDKEYRSISYDGRSFETAGLLATDKDANEWCIVK